MLPIPGDQSHPFGGGDDEESDEILYINNPETIESQPVKPLI